MYNASMPARGMVFFPLALRARRLSWDKEAVMSEVALRLVQKENMDKNKALDAALTQIERAFGKGSIMRLGQNQKAVEIDAVSTGAEAGVFADGHEKVAV